MNMSASRGVGQIVRQGASVAATRLVLIIASFVSSVVVARALTLQERGKFGLLVAVAALAIQFGNLGVPMANTYLVARQPQLVGSLVANTVRGFMIVCILLAVCLAAALRFVSAWTPLWGAAGVAVWLVATFGLAQLLAQNLMAGRFQFSISNGVDLVSRIGAIAGMAALWALGGATALWFAVIAALFGGVATWWGLRAGRIGLILLPWDGALARRQFDIGSRAYLCCLATFVLSRLPLYAVEPRGGLSGLAYYTQALVIGDTMLVVPAALGTVLFPSLAAIRDSGARIRATLKMAGITAVLMLLGATTAVILGPRLIPLIYGKNYAASMPVLLAMLPGIVALGICSVMQNALSANGYPWTAVFSPIASVLAVTVGLVATHSVIGCAWAYSAGALVMLCYSSLGWWLHRNDWTEIQTLPIELMALPDA